MTQWLRLTRQHPSAVLLFVQLLGIVAYPFLGEAPVGRAVFGTFALVVLAIAVMAIRMTPALSWVAVLLGGPVIVLTVLEATSPDNEAFALWSAVFHAAFYFYTAFALIRYMFSDTVVTTDEVFATGATFTVLAWAFAYVYAATQLIWPDSFNAAVNTADPRSWTELLFLSVTTLTSTGLSDITPIRPHARSFVMIEQIAGMLYLALVVARIMALLSARATRLSASHEEVRAEAWTPEPDDDRAEGSGTDAAPS
ncbi:ion channel [Nocardioides sp. Soil796]|uniref:ion channel n=1 Tax=Nocardioides sp. Soil796 TaxID=1736412 RepID=UPI0009E90830|nr:ion channel [Nocardioides sp. Soil796]